MVDVDETYRIMDDVELPLAKAVAAHSNKSNLDPIQKEKGVSLDTNKDNTRFDNISDNLWGLFSTHQW
jgi:hypothetical protein